MAPAAAVAVATLLASTVQGAPSTTSFCAEAGWTQIWADEFDGDTLNESSWTVELGSNNSRTRDAQGTADNVYLKDGSLVLRSQRQKSGSWNFTTGAVDSKGKRSWTGPVRICIRAKLPGGGGGKSGYGIWPAHWLMPDNNKCWPSNGEVDVMEMVNGDGTLRSTYHWTEGGKCSFPYKKSIGKRKILGADWATEFHEYAVEYSDTHMAFAYDGKAYTNLTEESKTTKGSPATFFPVPYYVILNTAIGGFWPKPVTASTTFPTYHVIDYVRVSEPDSEICLP